MSLGENIKKYRHDLRMTQEELARILCVTGQAVSKWESGAGLPDITQVIPLAQALNITTDALFGFSTDSYDMKLAEEVGHKANILRDTGEQEKGALDAVTYLEEQCTEHIFNYGIMTYYVRAVAHMSRFVTPDNQYYTGLLKDDAKIWKQITRTAENRAMQVIRYSGSKKLYEECHYALAWLCWHNREWDKGRQHIEALPSIGSNMLQETLLPYFIDIHTDEGKENWNAQIRDNYQNFIRAINKQIVYTAESMMWISPAEDVEKNCMWGLSIMDDFMKDDRMTAYCQGFYRDTYKYMIGSFLRADAPEKAAGFWKDLMAKIDGYVGFCSEVRQKDPEEIRRIYGTKAADNMDHYTREWIDSKITFILGQLRSWSDKEVYRRFEDLIK